MTLRVKGSQGVSVVVDSRTQAERVAAGDDGVFPLDGGETLNLSNWDGEFRAKSDGASEAVLVGIVS